MTDNAYAADEAGSTSSAISGRTPRTGPLGPPGTATGLLRNGAVSTEGKRSGVGPVNVTRARRASVAGEGRHGSMMRVSRLSVPVLTAAFLLGVVKGAVEYSHRSAILERHVAGTNAITIHVVLAIVAAAVVITIQVRRSGKQGQRGPSPWTAPFSGNAVARLSRAVRLSRGAAVARVLLLVPLILVLLYCAFRMGAQVIGGLDPNSTVNAWGGPTYAGAMLAHWLDCAVGFYAAAFLLGRLLAAANGHGRRQRHSSSLVSGS